MEKVLRYRSLEAFCRHRARIEGESPDVWLEKANILASLASAEIKPKASAADEEISPQPSKP
jgi:hypothetical protein